MIRINLIRATAPRRTPQRLRAARAIAVATMVLLPAAHLVQGAWLASLEERHAKLAMEVESLRTTTGKSPVAPARVQQSPRGAVTSVERLRAIAGAAPPELWVVAYRQRGNAVTINGIALNGRAADSFAGHLSRAESLRRVEIIETSLREPRGKSSPAVSVSEAYEFTLTAEVGDPIADSEMEGSIG